MIINTMIITIITCLTTIMMRGGKAFRSQPCSLGPARRLDISSRVINWYNYLIN